MRRDLWWPVEAGKLHTVDHKTKQITHLLAPTSVIVSYRWVGTRPNITLDDVHRPHDRRFRVRRRRIG